MGNFIIGYSGHSYSAIQILIEQGIKINGYFDINEKDINPFKIKHLGHEKDFNFKENDSIFIAIGDNTLRSLIATWAIKNNIPLFSIIDSTAILKSKISNDGGILINARAVIQPSSIIGVATIINSGAIIEHECKIGDFVHIGPGAVLTGNVEIGDFSLIGANSTILPGVKIGKNSKIGAGSVVTKDVQEGTIIKGNPAK
jgi:sugar O-acyltransferase (sialic acid O-acetyltransferase NeuD family)